jgi:hypothetical protein
LTEAGSSGTLSGVSNPAFEEVLKLAQDLVDHRSRAYVSDGMVLAQWILTEGKAALEENKSLKADVEAYRR